MQIFEMWGQVPPVPPDSYVHDPGIFISTVRTPLSPGGVSVRNYFQRGCLFEVGLRKSERISKILYTKLLEKTETIIYIDSNVNLDGMKEGNVAKTVLRIKN